MPVWIEVINAVFDALRYVIVYPLIAISFFFLCLDVPSYLKRIAIILEKMAKEKER